MSIVFLNFFFFVYYSYVHYPIMMQFKIGKIFVKFDEKGLTRVEIYVILS